MGEREGGRGGEGEEEGKGGRKEGEGKEKEIREKWGEGKERAERKKGRREGKTREERRELRERKKKWRREEERGELTLKLRLMNIQRKFPRYLPILHNSHSPILLPIRGASKLTNQVNLLTLLTLS